MQSNRTSEIDDLLIKSSLDNHLFGNKEVNRRLRELSDSEFERWVGEGLLSKDDVIKLKTNLLTSRNSAVFLSTLFKEWINTGKFKNLDDAADFARRLGSVHTGCFAILASQECKDLVSKDIVNPETMVLFIETISSVCSLENIGWHIDKIAGSFEKRCEIERQYFRQWTVRLCVYLLSDTKVKELLQQGLPEATDQIREIALSVLVKYRDAAIKFSIDTEKYFKSGDAVISTPSDERPDMKSINELQKRIIDGTLAFPIQSICELEPNQAIDVLRCLLTREVSPEALLLIVSLNIEDEVKFFHDVMLHPCPQNRSTSYPYFGQPNDPSMIVYKNQDGRPAFEKRGLLSLTANNDESTSVTKEATCNYIVSVVEAEINKLSQPCHSAISAACSFWDTDSVQQTFDELINNLNQHYLRYKELDRDLVSKIKTFPKLGLLFSRSDVTADKLEMFQCLLLHFSEIGDVESVKGLLSHNKIDVNFIKYFGKDDQNTALSEAAYHGHPEVVRLLLSRAALIDTQNSGLSPFLWAVRKGHVDVVRVFVEARAFSDLVPANDVDKLQRTLTHLRLDCKGIRDDAKREEKTMAYNTIAALLRDNKSAGHNFTSAKPPTY